MFVKDKVAIITGGATGIGLCYVKELLKNGLRGAVIADTNVTNGNEAVEEVSKIFGPDKVIFVETDVTDQNQMENAFKRAVEKFKNIDILINNAGVMDETAWEKEILINLNGTFHGCLLAMEEYMPKYKSGEEGLIVNVASIAGLRSFPSVPIYTATKHAIVGLSKTLGSSEHYDSCKIKILTICPGVTDTVLMSGLSSKMLNERYLEVLKIGYRTRLGPSQSAEVVAEALIDIIKKGSNGSFWVIEGGELYEVDVPEKEIRKIE